MNPVVSFYSEPKSLYTDVKYEIEREAKIQKHYSAINNIIMERRNGQRASKLFYEMCIEVKNPEQLPWLPRRGEGANIMAYYGLDWDIIHDVLNDLAKYWNIREN